MRFLSFGCIHCGEIPLDKKTRVTVRKQWDRNPNKIEMWDPNPQKNGWIRNTL
jgi:hypothetical protein